MTDTIQTVHLADNINAAFDKINENFEGLTDGTIVVPHPTDMSIGDLQDVTLTSLSNGEVLKWNGSSWTNLPDSGSDGGSVSYDSSLNQYITNLLDSSFFLTVINEEYLEQFTINTNVNDSDINANTSAILSLESRIDQTDSGITVLSQIVASTQAQLDSMVLGGIDSDLLASAIASANSTIISRIDANSDGITSFAGVIDSVENDMLLRDSATNDLIEINTSAISALSSRIDVNSDGLSVVVGDVTNLSLSLNQLISDGITLTPEQITEAIGGALDSLTLRMNADSDKLVIEAEKIVDLETGLTAQESDLGAQITAVSNAQSQLVSRTEYNALEGTVTATASDVTNLQNEISVTNPDGTLSTAIADAKSELISYVDTQGNTVSTWGIDLVAGTQSNPKVAGIKFGNDGATADFEITADTFRILPTDADSADSGTAPFSVVGGVVELSDAKVTGEIDVTTSDSDGSMNIKGNLITISDGAGNMRVKLGKLT